MMISTSFHRSLILQSSEFLSNLFKKSSSVFFNDLIAMPALAGLADRMKLYAALGIPGAMGSVDCTRVRWDKCAESIRNLCIGKEHFPVLSFLVVVDHNRNIIHVSPLAYPGSMNDINITNVDPFMQELIAGKYQDIGYDILNNDGTKSRCYGAFLISDNGFVTSPTLIDPMKNRYNEDQVFWSEWLESVRKDVECTFGILKIRFRIL
jgi:hypothetical protein